MEAREAVVEDLNEQGLLVKGGGLCSQCRLYAKG
jgi:valyl-tRNA synthetase